MIETTETTKISKRELSAKVNKLHTLNADKNYSANTYDKFRKEVFKDFTDLEIKEHLTSAGIKAEITSQVKSAIDLSKLIKLVGDMQSKIIDNATISETSCKELGIPANIINACKASYNTTPNISTKAVKK